MEQLNEFDIEEVCELEVDIEQVGPRGLSAYEVYLQTGGTLSEEEWLESLKGITPTIGANGNWFLGDTDTGLSSRGEKGETGGISHEEVKVVTGELENLSTEDKTSLVNAINELVSSGTSSNAILVHDNKISITGNLISVSTDARIEISKLLNKNIDKVVLICVYNSSKKISLYYLLKVDIPTKNATISHDIQGLVVYGTSLYSCNGIMFVGTDATTITGVGFGNIYINQYASKTDVDTTTGDLTTLMTVDKTSLVNAINEMVNNSSWITEITEDKAKLYEYPEGIYYTTKSVNVAVGYSTSEGKKLIIIGRKNNENTVMVFLKDGYFYSDYHNFAKYYGYNNLVLLSDVLTKTNKSSYKPSNDYNPATKLYVDQSIETLRTQMLQFNIMVVEELPSEDISTSTIYLISKNSDDEENVYYEYIYVNDKWEKIGDTKIDLTNYATEEYVKNTAVLKVFEGKNIDFESLSQEEKLSYDVAIIYPLAELDDSMLETISNTIGEDTETTIDMTEQEIDEQLNRIIGGE